MKSILFFIATLISLFVLFPASVSAQSVKFPIPELGYCEDLMSCYAYCQKGANTPTCWSYSTYVLHQNVLGDETKAGITFPVPELGNCANTAECKIYCSDAAHFAVCSDFAAKHGLNKNSGNQNGLTPEILQAAKTEFGCQTAFECRALCQQPENATKCADFGEKFGLTKAMPVTASLLVQAKSELGCTSMTTCRAMCALSENSEKCVAFGEKVGLISKEVVEKIKEQKGELEELLASAKTDLGCTTANECRIFCQKSENKNACRTTIEKIQKVREIKKKEVSDRALEDKIKTSGCTTTEECRKACELSPEKCPDFPKRAEPTKKPTLPQTSAKTNATNAKKEEGLRKNSNSGPNDIPITASPTKNEGEFTFQ